MDVLNLSLPLFGLVLLGWLAAKWKKIPESGLAWMQFYIIYVALPAMFFQILRKTPVEQLTNFTYILGTTGTTLSIFTLAFLIGRILQKNKTTVATMQAVAGSYSNVGYMGPALTLPALGEAAVVPTALILCFDNAMLFTIVPILMAMGTDDNCEGILKVLYRRVLLHPFILATLAGISAAYLQPTIPQAIDNDPAPTAGLFYPARDRDHRPDLDTDGGVNGRPASGTECLRISPTLWCVRTTIIFYCFAGNPDRSTDSNHFTLSSESGLGLKNPDRITQVRHTLKYA